MIRIVHIGSSPIDGPPIYRSLLANEKCELVGIDPQDGDLRLAIGDGREHVLHRCSYPGWSSLLKPSEDALKYFDFYKANARVISSEPIATTRLNDLEGEIDFLVMDCQGSELMILRHGRSKLKQTSVVHLELPFVGLYENQPTLGHLDGELRGQGFIPHAIADLKTFGTNQLMEADFVYVKDFLHPESISEDQLAKMSIILQRCYQSTHLANYCMGLLSAREVTV